MKEPGVGEGSTISPEQDASRNDDAITMMRTNKEILFFFIDV
jgi:hypothetical protein